MTQADVFAQHDRVAGAQAGSVLMVCEPIRVQRLRVPSDMIAVEPGKFLRVKFMGGGLWCEAAIDGQMQTVVVNAEYFWALEPKAKAPAER